MMTFKSRTATLLLKVAFVLAVCIPNLHAKVFDGGVDSANLGKGDWIYFVSQATNKLGGHVASVTDIPSLMQYKKSKGMDYILVKMGTGSTNFNGSGTSPQFNQELVDEAHKAGLKIFGYTRSYGDDIPGEVAMAMDCYELGADGFIYDAESEWESGAQGTQGPAKAISMLSQVKAAYPNKFLAHAPFPYINFHSSFPYKEFGYYCDAVMPQCYWYSIGVTPQVMVNDLDTQWRNWQNSLTGQWTNSVKPIAPIGQADDALIPASEITDFVNALKNSANPACSGGYQSVSWWRSDLHTAAQWTTIGNANIGGTMGQVHPIIIDNLSATYVGSWATASSSLDKYATDYRYKSPGTGTAWTQFRPSIWTAGSYQISEWHPAGSNRTTAAPHVIKHGTGSATLNVNQQINGGAWNVLGTYTLTADNGGTYVRVRDDVPDAPNLTMADAMRFVYVTPSAPSAATGVAATPVSSRQIDITWNDNASNEQWYEIARGTTSGGPYTNVLIAAANSTSFSDKSALPGTTYFYVVRAANAGGASANSSQATATSFEEIIIDNPDATIVGSWSSATGAADKFGADYRFKSGGTGSAYLEYTPNVSAPGDYEIYEWHAQGSNRTTNAPYVVTYNGGSTTVGVNQKVNGGKWNLIGTFNFAAGTGGNVKIQDNYADATQVIMADALKFVMIASTSTPAPNAPSSLTASAISTSQINLAWADNSNNENNFIVSRSTTSGGPYTDIVTLAANTTSYSNTGLTGGTTYYYVVRAANAGGSSASSNQASATTTSNPPTAPSGLTATATSSTQINLSWADNASNETSYIVSRSATSGGPYTVIATLGANVTSYNNTGLTPNTAYFYVVKASNSGGDSANSNEATATTQQIPAPSAPSGLTATAVSQTQINLTWIDNSSSEANFIIARSTTSGGPYTDIATVGANVTAYSNSGLTANTTYYYVVRASNAGGSSANSAQASATTLPNAPTAPSGLIATTASQTQINLSWTDNSGNESSFVLSRATTSGGPYTEIATLSANVTSYNDTGLTSATTYYYIVRASNAGGSSANSTEASATTLPTPPVAPSSLSATAISASQIDLSWADNSNNESSFVVSRSTTSGGPYTDIVTLAANTTAYSNTGLSTGVTYYYVVRASNSGGASANSNQASATTSSTPAAPSNLSAVAVRPTRIDLSWTDNSGNETGFVISRSTTVGGPYTTVTTTGANVTSYSNTGLTANTTYYYVVKASNAVGSSANSNEASATTLETDLLIDNKSAVVAGAWTVGSGATDKYASDYIFKGQGTGLSYVEFTPYIVTAGSYQVFEWHPQGSNRSTNAPHEINYNGGTYTALVNQKVNGGLWNLLGTFDFAAGTTGKIRVTDAFPDAGQVVMADAIKLVYVQPPSAPTTLTATTFSATRIDLTWVDTSTSEDNFIVARSTTSGGPYTDVAVLSANSTAYSDTGLSQNTTYYYVVRSRNASGSSANTVQASATTKRRVNVNSITMSWVLSGTKYKSRATVNVKDAAGLNVNSATVTGNFTGSFTNNGLTGVTSSGNAVITSTSTLTTGTITFTVTNITGSNMAYSSANNVVTSATHSR